MKSGRNSTDNQNKKHLFIGMILAAAVMWGCIGVFIRHLNAFGFSSVQITTMRCVINVILMFLLILVTDRKRFQIKTRDIGWFAANGLCSILVFYTAYQSAITLTSMPTAVALLYTAPAFVMIMSVVFFGEKFTAVKAAALILSVAGSALASGIAGGFVANTGGILLGLLSGFGYALYSIFGTVILRKYHPFTNVFYSFIFAAVGSLCICNLPDMLERVKKMPASLPWIIGCAVVTCFLSYLLYTIGLSVILASRAAIYACVEPVVATLIGIMVYKEKTGLAGVLGIIMVIAAILLLNVSSKKESRG